MEESLALYKIVGPAGEPLNGGTGTWPLPIDGQPGEWRDVSGPVVPCHNGLHLTDAEHLSTWLPRAGVPCVVYRAEWRGELVNADTKFAASSVRLLPRSRPMPDLGEADLRRGNAEYAVRTGPDAQRIARADAAYHRAILRAEKAAAKIVPASIMSYASAIRGDAGKLPPFGVFARIAEAEAARDAIVVPAAARRAKIANAANGRITVALAAIRAAYAEEVAGVPD